MDSSAAQSQVFKRKVLQPKGTKKAALHQEVEVQEGKYICSSYIISCIIITLYMSVILNMAQFYT